MVDGEMLTSAEEFVRLRTSENSQEYLRAANDEAPLEVWLDVIRRFPEMRFWVAQNKTVPIEILEILVEDEDVRVRWMVASKRKLPPHLQMKLATDKDEGVRNRIARNPKVTQEVLEVLSKDE